jgi:PAS domain-containing protein
MNRSSALAYAVAGLAVAFALVVMVRAGTPAAPTPSLADAGAEETPAEAADPAAESAGATPAEPAETEVIYVDESGRRLLGPEASARRGHEDHERWEHEEDEDRESDERWEREDDDDHERWEDEDDESDERWERRGRRHRERDDD